MANSNEGETAASVDDDRRRLLGCAGLAALLASDGAGAWVVSRPPATDDERDSGAETPTPDGTTPSDDSQADEVPAVVERHAPDLYFGALEEWVPTDPRQYVIETDGGAVVDGFIAVESTASSQPGRRSGPPAPCRDRRGA